MSDEFYNYDVWTDKDGNIAYLQANVDPDKMGALEHQFMNERPRKEGQSDEAYIEDFISFLLQDDDITIHVINRPPLSIMVHQ